MTGTPGMNSFCDAPISEDLQNTPFSHFAAFSFFSEFWYEIKERERNNKTLEKGEFNGKTGRSVRKRETQHKKNSSWPLSTLMNNYHVLIRNVQTQMELLIGSIVQDAKKNE